MNLPAIRARRVQVGSVRFYEIDGALYPSVTSILAVVGKPALVAWAKRTALEAVRAQLADLETITAAQLTQALSLAEDEPERQRDAAASRGTSAHEQLASQLARGGKDEHGVLETLGIRVLATEYTVVSTRFGFAGTCDLVGERGKEIVVLDWKTGGVWPEHALQLGAYAIAIEEMTGHAPAAGYVIGLRSARPVIHRADLPLAREAFLAARTLFGALNDENLLKEGSER